MSTTEIKDSEGRRPLEELLAQSEELRRLYADSFTKLPAIEKLTELWAARESLSADDPIFIQAEMLGLFEIRYRSSAKALVDMLQQQDAIIATLISELEDKMQEFGRLEKSTAELNLVIVALKADQVKLAEVNAAFLEVLPDVHASIQESAKLINDKSMKSVLLTWAGMIMAMGAGAVLALLLKR